MLSFTAGGCRNALHVNSIRLGCIILKPGGTKPPKYLKEEAPSVQNVALTDIQFNVFYAIVFKFMVWDAIVIGTEDGRARIHLFICFSPRVIRHCIEKIELRLFTVEKN